MKYEGKVYGKIAGRYIELIDSGRPEWISVDDRLPEFETTVLVFYVVSEKYNVVENGLVRSIVMTKDSKSAEWIDSMSNAINPTHWMPLPEPPKKV